MSTWINANILLSINNLGIRINTDFLEANVVNIFLLFFGLVYVLRKFLGESLRTRQKNVCRAIQEAEESLRKAHQRYLECEKQFKQTEIVIKQIEQEAIVAAEKVRQSILLQGQSHIDRLTENSKISIAIAERQVKESIQQQITDLAMIKVREELKQQITSAMQIQIINENIAELGDKI